MWDFFSRRQCDELIVILYVAFRISSGPQESQIVRFDSVYSLQTTGKQSSMLKHDGVVGFLFNPFASFEISIIDIFIAHLHTT